MFVKVNKFKDQANIENLFFNFKKKLVSRVSFELTTSDLWDLRSANWAIETVIIFIFNFTFISYFFNSISFFIYTKWKKWKFNFRTFFDFCVPYFVIKLYNQNNWIAIMIFLKEMLFPTFRIIVIFKILNFLSIFMIFWKL